MQIPDMQITSECLRQMENHRNMHDQFNDGLQRANSEIMKTCQQEYKKSEFGVRGKHLFNRCVLSELDLLLMTVYRTRVKDYYFWMTIHLLD